MGEGLIWEKGHVNWVGAGILVPGGAEEALADPTVSAAYLDNIPAGRFAECDDVVGAAIFLASDESSFVTGQTVECAGGATI